MSLKRWPYYPDRLSDVIDPEMIIFTEIAAGAILSKATVILEMNGDMVRRFPPDSIVETKSRTSFCNRLRGGPQPGLAQFVGGEEACCWFDGQVANAVLAKTINNRGSKLPPEKYLCHMCLQDLYSVVYIADRFPVAVLLTGQCLPTSANALQAVEGRVDCLTGKARTAIMPFSDWPSQQEFSELAIQTSPSACEKLKGLAGELELWEPRLLDVLRTQTEKIERIATNAYRALKEKQLDSFFDSLGMSDDSMRRDR
jgi:hypothetical protein